MAKPSPSQRARATLMQMLLPSPATLICHRAPGQEQQPEPWTGAGPSRWLYAGVYKSMSVSPSVKIRAAARQWQALSLAKGLELQGILSTSDSAKSKLEIS